MHLKIYNNTLLAPLKCGTRYLDMVFNHTGVGFDISEFKKSLFLPNVTDIVIRPPMEHLTSALHTAILTFYNNDSDKRNEDISVDLTSIIDEFCIYEKTDEQNTHWRYDIYETLYWLWRRNKNKINIIELKDLSLYLQKLNIKKLPKYDSKDYDFHFYPNWCTKDEIMLFIKTNYPEHWENLMTQIEEANKFYDYLINKELIEIKLL
jgi:hypothetical protein